MSHTPYYNNRFRSSGSGSDMNTSPAPGLQSVSQSVVMFEHHNCHSTTDQDDGVYHNGYVQGVAGYEHPETSRKFHSSTDQDDGVYHNGYVQGVAGYEHPGTSRKFHSSTDQDNGVYHNGYVQGMGRPAGYEPPGTYVPSAEAVQDSHKPQTFRQQSIGDTSFPMFPGKPRRLSRQTSSDVRRQLFAEGREVVLSVESGCDEVFVEVTGEADNGHPQPNPPYDSSLFASETKPHVTFSTSSTTSILPNPYNSINHRIYSIVWCCGCLYFVFFCCLPAIHYMERCDVEFNRNNQKRARSLGRTASFFFFTGTLMTISVFAMILFLAIFFSVY